LDAAKGVSLIRSALLLFLAIFIPVRAHAQQDAATFLAGGAIAFAMHEAGHVVFDFAFDAAPGIKKVSFGPIPFFAITHPPMSRRREFIISSAGFWVQEATSEIVLARDARLRERHAPLVKGILAFNVIASAAYAGAAFATTGPPERDTRGMAVSAGIREPWIGGVVLAPAVFDAARYYKPDSRWLRWASRISKVGGVLLLFKAD
jgi:hypothetical protein